MSKFVYKAKKGPKKIIRGTIEADTLEDAIAKILQSGDTPVDIRRKDETDKPKSYMSFNIRAFFSHKIPPSEITLFTRQISDLIDADIPVLQVLDIVSRQTKHPQLKEIIENMYVSVKDGSSLSAALAQFPQAFSLLYSNMIKSGELTGNLNVVVSRLADLMERDDEVRSQIKTSLLYPALIFFVGGIVIFVLFTWGIPRIAMIFEDLNETLPLPTLILLGISGFFAKFWWLILSFFGIVVFYIKRLQSTSQGKLWLDNVKLKIPVFGNYVRDAQIGRFARILGTLLDSGVMIVTALSSVCLVIDNDVLRHEIQLISQKVSDGSSLAVALKESSLFPETVVNMVAVGEQTGRVHRGLYKLATYYERQSQRFVKRVTSLVEPVLILIIGSMVLFIVMALLMPIFRMNLIIQ